MAEILIRMIDNSNPFDNSKDLMCYKKGMPVVVRPDGHEWGLKEKPPNFAIIRIPGVPVPNVQKYIELEMDTFDPSKHYRRREWQLQVDNLPEPAKNKLKTVGLIVKARANHLTPFDEEWSNIRQHFKNLKTGQFETEDI